MIVISNTNCQVLYVILPVDVFVIDQGPGASCYPCQASGGFYVLYDEAQEAAEAAAREEEDDMKAGYVHTHLYVCVYIYNVCVLCI